MDNGRPVLAVGDAKGAVTTFTLDANSVSIAATCAPLV
jgi:hypothetical protein